MITHKSATAGSKGNYLPSKDKLFRRVLESHVSFRYNTSTSLYLLKQRSRRFHGSCEGSCVLNIKFISRFNAFQLFFFLFNAGLSCKHNEDISPSDVYLLSFAGYFFLYTSSLIVLLICRSSGCNILKCNEIMICNVSRALVATTFLIHMHNC